MVVLQYTLPSADHFLAPQDSEWPTQPNRRALFFEQASMIGTHARFFPFRILSALQDPSAAAPDTGSGAGAGEGVAEVTEAMQALRPAEDGASSESTPHSRVCSLISRSARAGG